jgi:hypothetical protein
MNPYLIAGFIVLFGLTTQTTSAAIFESTPDKVLCSFKERTGRPAGKVVLYIDTKFEDGTAWYRSIGESSRVVILDANGNFKSTTRLFLLKDCEKL